MISLTWVLGIVGTLGLGGMIVAYFFFPAAMAVLSPIISKIIEKVMACKVCLYALALVAAVLASFWYGHYYASAQCREGELAAQLRNKQIDLEIAKKSAADEAARASKIESDANDQHDKDAKYIEDLQNVPACLLDDTDVNGMRKPIWSGRAKSPFRSKKADESGGSSAAEKR